MFNRSSVSVFFRVYLVSVLSCGCVFGMHESVSCHLFSSGQEVPLLNLSEDKKSELSGELSVCNKKFQDAPCTQLEEIAESLIDKYKTIYTDADKEKIALIEKQEDIVFDDVDKLVEAGDEIIKARKGLPEAARHLSSMYEVIGIYNVALLWSYVAYKQGLSQSKNDACRLLLLVNTY